MTTIEYLKANIEPKAITKDWLEDHTKLVEKHGKTFRGCDYWINIKLYFQTDDIRIYWNKSKCTIQVRDDEPETMKKSEFTEQIAKPAALWFDINFTRVNGTQQMLDNFFKFCKDTFDDDLQGNKMIK